MRRASSRSGSHSGFTLIELLVVISIIALLISLLLPSLSKSRVLARETQLKSNMRAIGTALYAYAADNNASAPIDAAESYSGVSGDSCGRGVWGVTTDGKDFKPKGLGQLAVNSYGVPPEFLYTYSGPNGGETDPSESPSQAYGTRFFRAFKALADAYPNNKNLTAGTIGRVVENTGAGTGGVNAFTVTLRNQAGTGTQDQLYGNPGTGLSHVMCDWNYRVGDFSFTPEISSTANGGSNSALWGLYGAGTRLDRSFGNARVDSPKFATKTIVTQARWWFTAYTATRELSYDFKKGAPAGYNLLWGDGHASFWTRPVGRYTDTSWKGIAFPNAAGGSPWGNYDQGMVWLYNEADRLAGNY